MDTRIPVWLDCDPGHDDATAIMLAGRFCTSCYNNRLLRTESKMGMTSSAAVVVQATRHICACSVSVPSGETRLWLRSQKTLWMS